MFECLAGDVVARGSHIVLGCIKVVFDNTSNVGLNELHILTNLFELETFIAEVDTIDVLDVDAGGTVRFLRHDVAYVAVLCFILILDSDFFVCSSACRRIEEAVVVVGSAGVRRNGRDVIGYVDGEWNGGAVKSVWSGRIELKRYTRGRGFVVISGTRGLAVNEWRDGVVLVRAWW
jgi:hypothetical protein